MPRVQAMTAARNRTNAAWLRAQLEGLRWAAAFREIPHHEWRHAVERLLRGEPWGASCA